MATLPASAVTILVKVMKMSENNNDLKGFFYTESDQMRKYFNDKSHIEFNEKGSWFEGKVLGTPLIGMQKKKDFPFLASDERTLNFWVNGGHVCLKVTHKQLVDLKRQLFLYEAVHLEKAPDMLDKEITAKDVAWKF